MRFGPRNITANILWWAWCVWFLASILNAELFAPGIAHVERIPLPPWSKLLLFNLPLQIVQAAVGLLLARARSRATRRIGVGLLSLNLLLVVVQLILGWIYGP